MNRYCFVEKIFLFVINKRSNLVSTAICYWDVHVPSFYVYNSPLIVVHDNISITIDKRLDVKHWRTIIAKTYVHSHRDTRSNGSNSTLIRTSWLIQNTQVDYNIYEIFSKILLRSWTNHGLKLNCTSFRCDLIIVIVILIEHNQKRINDQEISNALIVDKMKLKSSILCCNESRNACDFSQSTFPGRFQ
jgi:predicted MPP superfamily phosphohydrolase